MSMVEDPRWTEYQGACQDVALGLSAPAGAHDRYKAAIAPFCILLAEECERSGALHFRKFQMSALVNGEIRLPLGVVLAAFRATEEEAAYVTDQPPFEQEPVSEADRLRAMPYGLYLKTPHWQKVRDAALLQADNACLLCKSTVGLQVHHRTYERRGSERPNDVAVLCDRCHKTHHNALRAA